MSPSQGLPEEHWPPDGLEEAGAAEVAAAGGAYTTAEVAAGT